ncbi:uncharacterized protein LOC110696333 [Chenopodium quinoa]|uniref:uncharacterized protein LOC110696333 n=1 Tax=Chenopodium quinoa TaxID=63459 RepID=UPI000B78E881|nr:uncharacterized protein LOC110696333 [Chenopodium quinoa]
MAHHYQDAMAIIRVLGPPDLFITFTCNPNWPEIVNEISTRGIRRTEDRPDIVARVFKIKLKQMLRELKDNRKFGKVIANFYVIEFQKRGLPHAHILITLALEDKPKCPEDIDVIISAEIPDKDVDPLAFETVTKNMLHGPCGPCLIDGKCSKHFPKKFCTETTFDDNGFVQYRRRQHREPIIVNGREVDNRWVVPYNRDLCIKYNAHINVERVAARSVVKYLYKYVTKGQDRATVVIENNSTTRRGQEVRQGNIVDEIKQYLDCRYVSAIEACWRIFEFDLQHQYPSTELLQFHLPGEQFVVFNDNDDLHIVLERPRLQQTMLTMWFQANKDFPEANQYTYQNFPMGFTWNRSTKRWAQRQERPCIGRLPFVHPNSGEQYYLRMLLTKVCGAESFEDIRTVDGVIHPTFRSACHAFGLLDDDNEWHETLSEASNWASGSQLRNMFCSILMFSEVSDPKQLWEQHWGELTDDLERMMQRQTRNPNLRLTPEEMQNQGLQEIEHILNKLGRSLTDFPDMPQPSSELARNALNRLIRDELEYDTHDEANRFDTLVRGLNTDQYRVYAAILDAHSRDAGGLFFVYDSGGTGKTYLWNTLIAKFRSERNIVLSVASSRIAALLLPGGKTAHSTFKIPFDPDQHSVCNFKKDSTRADLIREASLIIWDEAPMTHRLAFEAVDRHFKDICSDNRVFRGKLVVLGGDFRQILPVVPDEGRESIVAATLHRASFWRDCQVMCLRINMRLCRSDVPSDTLEQIREFADWIIKVGEGVVVGVPITEEGEPNWIEIPRDFLIANDEHGLQNLINFVYPNLPSNYTDWEYLKDRGILAPTNNDVDELNSKILSMLPGNVHRYYSSNTLGHTGDGGILDNMEPMELLNSLNLLGLPNHCLELKVGAPVILMRNMNQSIGLCNGTRLIIKKLGYRVIEEKVITGPRATESVLIPRIDLTPSNKKIDLPLKRRGTKFKSHYLMLIGKYKEIFKQGKVYSIAQLDLMPLDTSYKYSNNQMRLKFGNKTMITEILDDCDDIPSMETMRLTLWEGFAHDQGRFLFNELNQDHVLGASMVSVGSYYGKCLSTVGRTRLFIDPDIDETDDLHGW